MIKKTLFIAGGLLLLLTLLFGGVRTTTNYFHTMIGTVREKVDDSFSIDFHLKRARDQIAKLTPEIKRNKSKVAKEEVGVEKLEMKVKHLRTALSKDEQEILRLTNDLDGGKSHYVYVGTSYTAKQVEDELARRFEEFKTDKGTLHSLEQVLAARTQGLNAARENLVAMQHAQRQLRVRVANLEARLQMVEVAQTTTEFHFDENQLTKTRDLIDDLESRIRSAEKVVMVDPKLSGRITLEEDAATTGEITEKVLQYFNGQQEGAEVADSLE